MFSKKVMIGALVALVIVVMLVLWYMMSVDNVATFGLTAANSINSERALPPNGTITNGTTYLGMQGDGNLVTYINYPSASKAVANTATFGSGFMATLDNMGVLRVVEPGGSTKWTGPAPGGPTGTWHLKLLPTGTALLIGPDGSSRNYVVGNAIG